MNEDKDMQDEKSGASGKHAESGLEWEVRDDALWIDDLVGDYVRTVAVIPLAALAAAIARLPASGNQDG